MEFTGKLLENITQVVDIIRSNLLTILFAIALFSWGLLSLSDQFISYFHLSVFLVDFAMYIGLAAFTATLFIILWIISRLASLGYFFLRARFELSRLISSEKIRIQKYIDEDTHTYPFYITDGVIDRLIDKGLIYKARSSANSAGEQDYHLYTWVYQRIKSNPSLINTEND